MEPAPTVPASQFDDDATVIAGAPFVDAVHGRHRRALVEASGRENVVHLSVRLIRPLALPAIGRRDVAVLAPRSQVLQSQSTHPGEHAQRSAIVFKAASETHVEVARRQDAVGRSFPMAGEGRQVGNDPVRRGLGMYPLLVPNAWMRSPPSGVHGNRNERLPTLYRRHPGHRNGADPADLELIFPGVEVDWVAVTEPVQANPLRKLHHQRPPV